MTHETALIAVRSIVNSMIEEEQEMFYKALGVPRPKLGKPNKRPCYKEFMHLKVLEQKEANKNKN